MIGQMAMAWNGAHFFLYQIFVRLSGMHPAMAGSVFFAVRTDAAQRDMVVAAVKTALDGEEHQELRTRTLDAIKTLGGLAARRNVALHTVWAFLTDSSRYVPVAGLQNDKEIPEDHTAEMQRDLKEIAAVSQRLQALLTAVANAGPSLSIYRAQLETVNAIMAADSQQDVELAPLPRTLSPRRSNQSG